MPYVDFFDGGGELTPSLFENETVTLYAGHLQAGAYEMTDLYGEVVGDEDGEPTTYEQLSLDTQTAAIANGGTVQPPVFCGLFM